VEESISSLKLTGAPGRCKIGCGAEILGRAGVVAVPVRLGISTVLLGRLTLKKVGISG
jgi:hypothetical protein